MTAEHEGTVVRVAEDRARGVATYQGQCRCGWRGPRVQSPPGMLAVDRQGVYRWSAQLLAPTTSEVARQVGRHVQAHIDTLLGAPGSPTRGGT